MNYFKRALYSVLRRKGKSVLLFAVIFILGNVIAGAIAIQQSTTNVEKDIKIKLGASASIEMDWEKFEKDNEGNEDAYSEENYPKAPKLEVYEEIGELSYIKYFDYNATASFEAKKLKRFEFEDSENGGMMGSNYFMVKGVNYPKLVDIEENVIKLVDGKVFTQEDIDKGNSVAIISRQLAEKNNLAVGDQMVIDAVQPAYATGDTDDSESKTTDSKSFDFPVKVIGLFDPVTLEKETKKNSEEDAQQQWMSTEQINQIYMPNKTTMELSHQVISEFYADQLGEDYNPEDNEFYQPMYVLNKPEDVEAFKQEVQPLLPEYYHVVASSDQYDQIGGSMKRMAQISQYVVIAATGAALLIISLVVLLFMRDRKHELGIYLSLGETRGKVMGQIVIEMLVISLLALLLSLVTGNLLGSMVSDSLMNMDFVNSASEGTDMYYSTLSTMTNSVTADDVMASYKVTFSLGYILSYLVIGIGTVVVSAILPLLYILRLNPKKIMM